jgi:hypothetical protein
MASEESGLMTPTRNKPFPHLAVTTTANSSPNSLAGTSPTPRFSMQIVISARDLPDGMTLDPNSSESTVSKTKLSQQRAGHQHDEREANKEIHKLLLIPRNATVAEVIEAGLERLGIVGGVVAGGDDVEDKISKRRSVMRIKYGLTARFPGQMEGMYDMMSFCLSMTNYATLQRFPFNRITRSLTRTASHRCSSIPR